MISSETFKRIKAVVLDVDGVLTDGRAGYGAAEEIKFFNMRDGHWMKLAMRAGLKVGLRTANAPPSWGCRSSMRTAKTSSKVSSGCSQSMDCGRKSVSISGTM